MRIKTLGDLVDALDAVKAAEEAIVSAKLLNRGSGGALIDNVRLAEKYRQNLLDTPLEFAPTEPVPEPNKGTPFLGA